MAPSEIKKMKQLEDVASPAEGPGGGPHARQADASRSAAKKRLKPAKCRWETWNLQAKFAVSEQRARGVSGWPRSTHRHKSRVKHQTPLHMRLGDLALARPRYGYRRLTILLRREGCHENGKRVYRLYREAGLTVRVKRRKKLVGHIRAQLGSAIGGAWTSSPIHFRTRERFAC